VRKLELSGYRVVEVGVIAVSDPMPGLISRNVRPGTDDMTAAAAMTREQAIANALVGLPPVSALQRQFSRVD